MDPSEQQSRGGAASSSGFEFERFVRDVVATALNYSGASVARGDDIGVDYVLETPDGEPVLIEVKRDTPSTRGRIERLVAQLGSFAEHAYPGRKPRLVLAVPGVIGTDWAELVKSHGVDILNGPDLVRAAEEAGVPVPTTVQIARPLTLVKPPGMLLKRRLAAIEPGRTNGRSAWLAYQKLCAEALEYLFHPPLEIPRTENPNSTGVNRRDIVMANYAHDGYWAFMRTHYRADFVVTDAKNYRNEVKKAEVLQLANYLSHHGAGLFGVIITRKGPNAGAVWTIREQWVLHNKLIVVLNDDDLRQMLTARDAQAEPEAVIRQKIEDFRLGL